MVEKAVHVKQGDLQRRVGTVFMLDESRRAVSFGQESEPPYERGNAVTGVEQRGAGRWMV